jgi:DNA recombination protein RmuC
MTLAALLVSLLALAIGAVAGASVMAALRRSAHAAEMQKAAAERDIALAERDVARSEREKSDAARLELQRRVEETQQARAVAEATAVARINEAEKLLANHAALQKQLEDSFAALAQKAFKDVSESLVRTNTTQVTGALDTKKVEIEALLKPMREMLENYRADILKSEHARNESYGGLQEQIRTLLTAQESTQREASRLANALQSPTVRGSWGEITLRRCVELAGLTEYCDFFMQETVENEEGRKLRPDMLVRLPNNKVIAVDSKSPTNDYTNAAQATDEEQRKTWLASHAKNLKRHVDALSRKEYQASVGESLDFTVMFLPAEHFLSSALVTDPDLFEYAVQRKIYVASPTVLLPLLRAVHAGWKAERTEENAKKMHDAAVELFNRFVIAMEKIANVGKALETTVTRFNEAIRSIDTRLWPKGEELQRMAGSGKELGELKQLDALPLESSKLRLTMQGEEPGEVIPIDTANR